MAAPEMSVLIQVGQLPPGTKVGFVCGTEGSTESMCGSLGAAGIRHIDYECISFTDREALKKMLAKVDVVAGCRSVVDEVRQIVPEGVTVMEFGNVLEKGGVELLQKFLVERD